MQNVEQHYFDKAGVTGSFYYSDIYRDLTETKGTPSKREIKSKDANYVWVELTYPGYVYSFAYNGLEEPPEHAMLQNIKITDPDYRLGSWDIGIGSTEASVRQAYRNADIIIDAENGYIDGNEWIEFAYNDEHKVAQIMIYRGP